MKPRKWVLITSIICVLLIIALYLGKRHVEKNRNLETFLIQSISPLVRGAVDIQSIRIGFFSAHLNGVSLSIPFESFSVYVEHIKIGFSFQKLIRFKGDYSRAINKIIFISPDILFTVISSNNTPSHGDFQREESELIKAGISEQLPVSHIVIKDGRMRILDRELDTISIGERLNGTLTNRKESTEFNLNGNSGSLENNLQIKGKMAWYSGLHNLSVYLNRAVVTQQITLNDLIITAGTVSGDISFTFSDSLSFYSINSIGNLSFEHCTFISEYLPDLIDSISMDVSASGSRWQTDNFYGSYRNSTLKASGTWDFNDTPNLSIDFFYGGLDSNSINSVVPAKFDNFIGGKGEILGHVERMKPGQPIKIKLKGEGFNIGNSYDITLESECTLMDSQMVNIEFFDFNDGNISLSATGRITLDSLPVYNLQIYGSIDSLPFSGIENGSCKIGGTITGKGEDVATNLIINGQSIRILGNDFGNQIISINVHHQKVQISLESDDGIYGTLSVNNPFLEHPFANLHLKIESSPIKTFLKRKFDIIDFDSGSVVLDASGWKNSFDATFLTEFSSKEMYAKLSGAIHKSVSDTDNVFWTLTDEEFKIHDASVDLFAQGSVYQDSMVVDSLNIFSGLTGRTALYFNTETVGIDAEYEYHFPISKVLSMTSHFKKFKIDGIINGNARVSGTIEEPLIRSTVHLRDGDFNGIDNLQTDAIISWRTGEMKILPALIRKDFQVVASFDTVTVCDTGFFFSADFDDVDINTVLGNLKPAALRIESRISGKMHTSRSGFPLIFDCATPNARIGDFTFDSVTASGFISNAGLSVKHFNAKDDLVGITSSGYFPWSAIGNNQDDNDTLSAKVAIHGDLLGYIGKHFNSPIAGNGIGDVNISFFSTPGTIRFSEGTVKIPDGTLTVRPYVLDDIKNFSFLMEIDSSARVSTETSGTVKRRPITIFSNHDIPDGFMPFQAGPLDFGIIQVKTPKRGIDIHLPGFMPIGEVGDIEFQGKNQLEYFTLSGPIDKLNITGSWVLRSLEFTYPFLKNDEISWEFDPFPYVEWNFDLKAGDRRVMYFWDLAGKRRKILRFFEGYIDPTSIVKVRGRELDNTFRLEGLIRSFKGALYYGKMFDRNLNAGVEFEPQENTNRKGYNNLPIIWGSAESLSDTSRLNRTRITCMVQDPSTKAISERGRLVEGKTLNITFQLSSDFDEQPGVGEREFFKQAGLNFTTIEGAGELVSDFGQQYFHSYFLKRLERRLAKKIGLDVINIESSITSNYFNKLYSRQFDGLVDQFDYLALANVGITVGRYFLHDFLFLKARGELIPIDTLLRPEYSIGLEIQPNRYFVMDFNYGVHKGETEIEHDPRLTMQLMLPIVRLRKFLKF